MALRNFTKCSLGIIKSTRRQLLHVQQVPKLINSGTPALNKKEKEISVTFVKNDGTRIQAKGKIGDSLLDVVVNNDLPFDGFGACEGTLTCSTCHIMFKEDDFEGLPDRPSGEECDMLDLAHENSPTSRLGCQVLLSEKLDGLEVKLPADISDLRSS